MDRRIVWSAAVMGSLLLGGKVAEAQEREKFSQGVEYRIEATLDEAREVLQGRARLTYTNESPSVLDTIWIHQHLNAFRPESDWARRELEYGNRRFTDLGPDDHAYERFQRITVGGDEVRPVYPGAPDSTVAGIPLSEGLAPGESVTLVMDWEARPSTLPRRQGRRDRHYDFAQWYPRVAVFDEQGWQVQPLMPQGEFYGEFASFDVTLDLPQDQVIGATGVPVQGDPGWESARAPGAIVAPMNRDRYGAATADPLELLSSEPATGRKRVRWKAEDVHHFAWSTNPDYIYEGGEQEDHSIHVLYQPGDEESWGDGIVVERSIRALAWLESFFGGYPYPQVTNVHRIEGGGTEFPMLVMNGAPSQGLITHEIGHIYTHGILANNEWRDAWLDEGFVSFVTNWFNEETAGAERVFDNTLRSVSNFETANHAQPVATPSADFVTPQAYSTLSYSKGSAIFYMLRELVGKDDFRRAMALFYEQNALEHITEKDLQISVETIYGSDLSWFFRQWLHTSDRLDYTIGSASTQQLEDGRWRTDVEIVRQGGIWMPVTLEVGDTRMIVSSTERTHTVQVITTLRPGEAVLDPDGLLLEARFDNNRVSIEGAR